ncbi:protocadherin-11 X-linked-like [Mya arenaria]|uniref:protocadherin-11 X-linked-like n=1 Tax=Mya arenaria TaxID=6604 RepID=UPI0022E0B0E4|nr:protocadherin-11 X-linked-like [Mya arenaria]
MESFLNGKMKFLKGILYLTIYIVFWEYKHTEEQQLELVHWEKPALGRTDGNVTLATKLAENFAVGTVFTKLKAVSEPEEYIITYASVPDTFSVNNTGHVTVEFSAALDYEFVRSYVVAFEARNSVPSTVTMTITIEVEDRNDNAPMFSNNPTTVYIAPGLGKVKGSAVTTVMASDVDGNVNNDLTYAIQAGDDTTAKFAIRMYQGVITTTGVEFERDKYTLVVTAVDGGTPPLTGSTTVIVDMGNRQKGLRPGPVAWIFCVGLILGIKDCILGI